MSDNGNGHALGAAVTRLSLPVVVSIIAVAIAFIGLAGTAIGTLVVSTRDDTETIAALKSKNEMQDQQHAAALRQLQDRLDNLKSVYDQRLDIVVRDLTLASTATQTERSETRQTLTAISTDLSKLVADVRVIAERQNALGPRQVR